MNCETDFVARNEKFQELVASIARNTLQHLSPKFLTATNLSSLDTLTSDSILNISDSEGSGGTLADQVAIMVGHLQEKIAVPRGCTLCCTNGLLCAHVYNNRSPQGSDIQMGTYGAILHMIGDDSVSLTERDDILKLKALGERICQHIVGVNPHTIEEKEGSQALVTQQFLFDGSVTVGDLLLRNNVQVTRFVRYGLGEKESNPWTGDSLSLQ